MTPYEAASLAADVRANWIALAAVIIALVALIVSAVVGAAVWYGVIQMKRGNDTRAAQTALDREEARKIMMALDASILGIKEVIARLSEIEIAMKHCKGAGQD